MSGQQLPDGGSLLTALLAFSGVALTAVLGWFGLRGSQRAPLQQQVNDALRLLMEQRDRDASRLTARVSDLEHQLELKDDVIGDLRRDRLEQSGDIANLKQAHESMLRLQEKQGRSPIPKDSALGHKPDEGGEDI